MLFFVKNKLFLEKQAAMMQAIQEGKAESPAKYATIYCSEKEPGIGYSIFDVEDREQLDKILEGLKPFSETYEVEKVLTLQDFQEKMKA